MGKNRANTNSNGTPQTVEVDITETIILEVPFAPPVEVADYEVQQAESGVVAVGRTGLHVNVQLGAKAARGFMRLRNGLRENGAKLGDGRPVWTNADSLRFILEAMVDAAR
jgi:hypothetical protein